VNLIGVGHDGGPMPSANQGERMKISCSDVRRELANYMEDDVDAELRSRIERHFRECDGCYALYDSIRKVVRLVATTDIIELPAGFSRRLYERLSTISS
jgi:anti-sigma factor (TIGR02949 family)